MYRLLKSMLVLVFENMQLDELPQLIILFIGDTI